MNLDGIDWRRLKHAYGRATAVPRLLREAASDDAGQAGEAVERLESMLWETEEAMVYSASPAVVPFLAELAAAPRTHHRPRLLRLMFDIADAVWELEEIAALGGDSDLLNFPAQLEWARAARTAVQAQAPTLARLLEDGDPEVRAEAARILARFPGHGSDPLPALQDRAAREEDVGTAASMILSVGELARRRRQRPVAWLRERLRAARAREVRVAAGVALARCGAGLDDAACEAIGAELRAERSALDDQPWTSSQGRAEFLLSALSDDADTHLAVAVQALRTTDSAERLKALPLAGEVMLTWRAGPQTLLPSLVELCADPEASVRIAATRQIVQGGPRIADVADRLAELLDDPEAEVSGNAAWALSLVGDARAIPTVTAELAEPRLPIPIGRALEGLRGAAQELIPHVAAYLRAPRQNPELPGDTLIGVLIGLRSWGPRALPLLPELIGVLERGTAVPACAWTLGTLGSAAAAAVPHLRGLLEPDADPIARDAAAWALWQITGDAEEPLRVLGEGLKGGLSDHAVELLCGLGDRAAPVVKLIRRHLKSSLYGTGAACALYRITGNAERTLPRLIEGVEATPVGMLAVQCLGDIGPAAAPALAAIEEIATSPRVLATRIEKDLIATDLAYRDMAVAAAERIRR